MSARSPLAAAVLLLVAVSAHGSTWGPDGKPNDPATTDCPCDQITGKIRKVAGWTSDSANYYNFSMGDYGGLWNQQNHPLCGNADSKNDTITHKFKKRSGTTNNPYLHIQVVSKPLFSGLAQQMNADDPEWWWSTTCVVDESRPHSQMKTGTGEWQVIPMTGTGDSEEEKAKNDVRGKAHGAWWQPAFPANQPHQDPNAEPFPGPQVGPYTAPITYPMNINGRDQQTNEQNGTGHFLGRSTAKIPAGMKYIKTEVTLSVVAVVNGDNVKVDNWKVCLEFFVRTDMSTSKSYPY